MDVFTNTNKFKKIVIVLVFLILFNFCCPKRVNASIAGILDSILVGVAEVFFAVVDGVQNLLNALFIDEEIFDKGEVLYSTAKDRIDALGGVSNISVSAENIIKGKFLLMSPNIFRRIDRKRR